MANIIEIKNVSAAYKENIVLKNISLNICEKSFVSVIGPNGAGKTTLLTIINGLCEFRFGSVKVCGIFIKKQNMINIRKKIGYVPQHVDINPRSPISVREVVSIGRIGQAGFFNNLSLNDWEIVELAMNEVGITNLAKRPIGHLSSGEQQKVAIARALAQNPKIILFDEPTSNLDPKSQKNILNLINKIYKEKKITIVFVTHILNHIPDCCEELIFVKHGKIMWQGEMERGFNEQQISDLYDYPMEIISKNGRKYVHSKKV